MKQVKRDQRGASISVLAVFFALAVVLLMGLVVEGGALLNARQKAAGIAREAARTAGQELDAARSATGGGAVVQQAAATRAGLRFLRAAGASGTVTVSTAVITVTATIRWNPTLIRFGGRDVTAAASVRLATGP